MSSIHLRRCNWARHLETIDPLGSPASLHKHTRTHRKAQCLHVTCVYVRLGGDSSCTLFFFSFHEDVDAADARSWPASFVVFDQIDTVAWSVSPRPDTRMPPTKHKNMTCMVHCNCRCVCLGMYTVQVAAIVQHPLYGSIRLIFFFLLPKTSFTELLH